MSHCQASKDDKFRGTRKDQANSRHRVSKTTQSNVSLTEIRLAQTRSTRQSSILEPHDRGCEIGAQPLHSRHIPLLGRLQGRRQRQVRRSCFFPSTCCSNKISRSPGYALSLLAESTTGAMHSAEAVSQPGVTPEDIALQASRALLSEINRGGCVDRQHQTLVLLMMVLGSEDVGRCRMSEPTPRT